MDFHIFADDEMPLKFPCMSHVVPSTNLINLFVKTLKVRRSYSSSVQGLSFRSHYKIPVLISLKPNRIWLWKILDVTFFLKPLRKLYFFLQYLDLPIIPIALSIRQAAIINFFINRHRCQNIGTYFSLEESIDNYVSLHWPTQHSWRQRAPLKKPTNWPLATH